MSGLKLQRVIIFTDKMSELTKFYSEQLGLTSHVDPEYAASDWIEFDAGPTRISLHKAGGNPGHAGGAIKLAFYAKDVAKARAELMKRKVKMGEVRRFGTLVLCDGRDPAGNRIQLSNRK